MQQLCSLAGDPLEQGATASGWQAMSVQQRSQTLTIGQQAFTLRLLAGTILQ
ncbi:hypothetical protein D9M68_919270 [compost metagenome]